LGSGNTAENNASIVLRLQYGEHVFLFMGGAEGKDRGDSASTPRYVEKVLLDGVPDRLKATVLKIAHHGSETSSTTPFIQAVDPEIVVCSIGSPPFRGNVPSRLLDPGALLQPQFQYKDLSNGSER
jgi:competence protein ComEC